MIVMLSKRERLDSAVFRLIDSDLQHGRFTTAVAAASWKYCLFIFSRVWYMCRFYIDTLCYWCLKLKRLSLSPFAFV